MADTKLKFEQKDPKNEHMNQICLCHARWSGIFDHKSRFSSKIARREKANNSSAGSCLRSQKFILGSNVRCQSLPLDEVAIVTLHWRHLFDFSALCVFKSVFKSVLKCQMSTSASGWGGRPSAATRWRSRPGENHHHHHNHHHHNHNCHNIIIVIVMLMTMFDNIVIIMKKVQILDATIDHSRFTKSLARCWVLP